jgi:pimeloyl-ACP methyl ester carboxylesterase
VSSIAVSREGDGPEVLLVHGGASAATTWSGLESLAARFTLAYAHRRGYAPSPEAIGGRQDFEVDAADLCELLDGRPHVVAHSYGSLGALIAATRRPQLVRSLTLIEPPLYLDARDTEVARLEHMGNAVLTDGLDADPAILREFLTLAGAPVVEGEPLSQDVVRGVRRAHGSRLPSDARPALDVLRAARVRTLIASGDHAGALERICDTLAARLDAERVIAPGAGHFVAAAPGFAERLEEFLRAS